MFAKLSPMHPTLCLLFFLVPGYGAVPLVMSDTTGIKWFEDFDTSNYSSIITSSNHVIAVDYHLARGELYYSEGSGQICRTQLKPGGRTDAVVIAEVKLSDGLAVDWVHDTLYWTDVTKQTLEVSTLDGLYRTVLFSSSAGLEKPRAIVVDPFQGLLFWSDWGDNPKISSSGLDGKQNKTILSSNILWPNGLTLDLVNSKIYILDGYAATLSTCDYDGANFKVLSRTKDSFYQAFGITFYANTVYWNSWRTRTLYKMNIDNMRTETIVEHTGLKSILQRMMGLKAVHSRLQKPSATADPCKNTSCSQWCLVGRDLKPTCMCGFGFSISSDGKTCIEHGYLLVSWRKTIRRYSINGDTEEPLIDTAKGAISLGYHLKKGLVFWSDIEEHRIYRAPLEQLNNKTVVATPETCDGLTVDWVHDVLYWTDTDRNTLEAAQLDGTKHMVIFSTDLDQPRDIAVDPFSGIMFWTDWGATPKMERSTLDGLERKVIIRNNQAWPNGITLDIESKKIYWVDGKLATISSCSYDGSEKSIIFIPSDPISLHLFSITLLEDDLFWTDWHTRSIYKSPKNEITVARSLATSSNIIIRPNGIRVVHSSLQKRMDNPCTAVQCTNLCLGTKSHEAHCMNEERDDIDVRSGANPVHRNLKKTVLDDSINIAFDKIETPALVAITLKCIGREGCTDDFRCKNQSFKSYVFHNQSSFNITDLLRASHYEVNFMSPNLIESFNVSTSNSGPPENPKFTSVIKQGTKLIIKWDDVDRCVPSFNSYHYKLFKTEVQNELAQEGSTNLTEVALENLEPEVSYTIHVYTSDPKHFSSMTFDVHRDEPLPCQDDNLLCNGIEDCPDGRDEDTKLCAGIENIVVYKNSGTEAYFRVLVTNHTAKQLDKFVGNYISANSKNTFEMTATPCTMWPDAYCFHISALQRNTVYDFKISAALKTGKVGNKFIVTAITKEKASEPPENASVVRYNATCLIIQWKHPNRSNGIIKSYIINIDETETFIEDICCQSFPMIESSEITEVPLFDIAATQLTPAATYAISISAKNMYVGMPATVVASTPPPPMEILKPPKVQVKSLSPLSWQRSEEPGNLSQYQDLIRSYMLLLLPPKNDPVSTSGYSDLGPLKELLQSKIGERFIVVWHKKIEDTSAFQNPVVVPTSSRREYKLVWVQVSQYNDAYSVDLVESDPFIAL